MNNISENRGSKGDARRFLSISECEWANHAIEENRRTIDGYGRYLAGIDRPGVCDIDSILKEFGY